MKYSIIKLVGCGSERYLDQGIRRGGSGYRRKGSSGINGVKRALVKRPLNINEKISEID